MPLLHTSNPPTFGTVPSGRNDDYTKIYDPDTPGEEAKENARIWKIYLDEAENYDADMIQSFRNIMDSTLVFAALFSAVVTTFVAQTSQSLQPDNEQIMAALFFENNQLLRASGNRTAIKAIPASSLAPGSRTHTSIDVWVNGLFFTSLALSLSTALFIVLAKQWIQAYTSIVPGDAKTRALIRHFRFQGLEKWKLGDIIESLPIILHCSVAIFLFGLALYVSQLSFPIYGVISGITALTFIFYFFTSMLPAFDIACPYRIPIIFSFTQFFASAFVRFYGILFLERSPKMLKMSLRVAEHNEVFEDRKNLAFYELTSLYWIFDHSSNHSVKEAVIAGAWGMLTEQSQDWAYVLENAPSLGCNFFSPVIVHSLSQLLDMISTSVTEDEIMKSTHSRLLISLMKLSGFKSLLDITKDNDQEAAKGKIMKAYGQAITSKYHALSQCFLSWVGPNWLGSINGNDNPFLFLGAVAGDAEDIHNLVEQGADLLNWHDDIGWTALHSAAANGNLNGVIVLVDLEPALISAEGKWLPFSSSACTPLDLAVFNQKSDVVLYLLDHGASLPSDALHASLQKHKSGRPLEPESAMAVIEVLLDHGWDRTTKDADGKTAIDIACSIQASDAVVEHLEHYQTARVQPYSYLATFPSLTLNEEAA